MKNETITNNSKLRRDLVVRILRHTHCKASEFNPNLVVEQAHVLEEFIIERNHRSGSDAAGAN
ncbi:MAG: hypothetical protein LBF69_05260 [Prevotellaceae bacterium]|jgi:hypothetical protein|nr:hypothetical protein [Prevotellaceae bacterium]